MAIFLGNWLDDEGAPFDPGAQHHRSTAGGGSAQNTRTGGLPSFSRNHFAACVSYHASKWLNQLTTLDKDDWTDVGADGIRGRGDPPPTIVNGFCAFNALHFVHTYYPDGTNIRGPSDQSMQIGGFALTEPQADTQTIGFDFLYTQEWAAAEHATLAVYQINPRALHRYLPLRDTRLIYKQITWPNPGIEQHRDVGAAFNFELPTNVAAMFRYHDGRNYYISIPDRWVQPPY